MSKMTTLAPQTHKYWAWMDPGAFALLGSVSFFGGVTRLTMSLTVIMVEITNDIHQGRQANTSQVCST